ncbi:MAG: gamma-glutamyltransferase [Melioribacteraceae bacterium]|nr:gamma-glutamyltransferase [Melioribacteraceae bacterium]
MKKNKHIKIFLTIIITFFATLTIAAQEVAKIDTSYKAMVVAAHPEAVKVGVKIIKNGGNAVDAAIASAFMIGVVEPHASGLGGGGGMVIYLNNDKSFHYIDYYMQTSLHPDTNYVREDIYTPRSICIPGTPAGLLKAHKLFGKLPLHIVLQPAIDIARNGFEVSEKFYTNLLDKLDVITLYPETEKLLFKNDFPVGVGDTVLNLELANVLDKLVTDGADYFYNGEFAKKAAEEIQKAGGYLTKEDFKNYKPILKKPAKILYRDYEIFSAPPPQSGATMLEILNIFENITIDNISTKSWNSETVHLFCEASKRADADRYVYMGDPATTNIPLIGLLSQEYANKRFADIDLSKIKYENNQDIPAGNPNKYNEKIKSKLSKPDVDEGGHTTHISVVDREGNAVSLTQTIGMFFGSGFSSQGVIFNSAMSIFYKKPSPNHIAPSRRPLTTISPTIIMKDGELTSVIGTPGGGRIFNVLAQKIIELIDFKISPLNTILNPRFNVRIRSKYLSMENGFDAVMLEDLKKMGYQLKMYNKMNSYFGGVQLIYYDKKIKQFIGVSDPRRDGGALGIN